MANGKRYQIDIDRYTEWENENGFGLVNFGYDDIVTVDRMDDEWANGVSNGRVWEGAIPAQFLIEVR